MLRVATVLAASLFATATGAQMQATPPADAPQQSAVRANNAVAADNAVQASTDADKQAQYQADLAAYDTALAGHDARADRQAEHYHHQQRAYADAMAAWRAQDYACRHGSSRACNAPSPDPAAFW